MARTGMTWTEVMSLKQWEIRMLHEHMDDIEKMKQNRR